MINTWRMVPLTLMMNIVKTMLMMKLKKEIYRRQVNFCGLTLMIFSSITTSQCTLNPVSSSLSKFQKISDKYHVNFEVSTPACWKTRKNLRIPRTHFNSLSDVGNCQDLWPEKMGHFILNSKCPIRIETCFARHELKNQHKKSYDHISDHQGD